MRAMTMVGSCYICGRPATTTCQLCGQLVCPLDVDPITHICRVCSKGAARTRDKMKVRRYT